MTLGTHRAAVCTALDGPNSVVTQDVADDVLGEGMVRVAVRASGVNFPDYLLTRGEYQLKLQSPFTPGMEVAGVVIESKAPASGSRPWLAGTPVIAVRHLGGFAEQIAVRMTRFSHCRRRFRTPRGRRSWSLPAPPIMHWSTGRDCEPERRSWYWEPPAVSATPQCS
jgi:NADPH:quinone reductase-like Zn-dependent oxidoreductase